MTDRELMQQALEALKQSSTNAPFDAHGVVYVEGVKIHKAAIAALNERLAQPEQEPVAWGVFDGPNLHDMFFTEQDAQDMARLKGDGSVVKPLCTTTPKRQWAGLTDEEVEDFVSALWPVGAGAGELLQAIEAKLKERNT